MKQLRTSLFVLFISAASLTSCSKIIPSVTFDFSGASAKFSTPPTTQAGHVDLGMVTVKTQIDSIKKANGVESIQLSSLKAKEAKVTITAPAGQNFDAFDDMHLYIGATGMTEEKLAYIVNVPKGSTVLNLTVEGLNFVQYFQKELISIRADGTANAPVANKVDMQADIKYEVITK